MCVCVCCFFFFQAEDGIRDLIVTGVQTCALPISLWYNMGDTDTDASVGPGSVDIDPELLGLDVAIAFAPDAPELVLGYVDASHEAEVGNTKVDVDYDHFSIGVRKSF